MTKELDRRGFFTAGVLGAGAAGVAIMVGPETARADVVERNVCVVADFGASGNGTSADGQAIQTALDWIATDPPLTTPSGATPARAGGIVHIPAGVYLTHFPLRLHSNTRIQLANGALLRRSFDAAKYWPLASGPDGDEHAVMLFCDEGAENITIVGGTFDANGTTYTIACDLLSGRGLTRLHIEGATFIDPHHHALDLAAFTDVTIKHCQFLGRVGTDTREAIQLDPDTEGEGDGSSSNRLLVDACYFGSNPNGASGSVSWPCGIGNHSIPQGVYCIDVSVTNCVFSGMTDKAIHAMGWVTSRISSNNFSGGGHAVYANDCVNLSIADNNVTWINKTFANLVSCQTVRVAGNSVYVAGQNGAWVKDCKDIMMSGNLFSYLGYRGAHIQGTSGVTMSGNTVIKPDTQQAGRDGIKADSGCDKVVIMGNTVDSTGVDIRVTGSTSVHITGNVHLD